MPYSEINESTTKITKYELFGKLPDTFLFNDGTRVKTESDWQRRRKELFETTVNLQFGGMPPEPEFLEVEPLCCGGIDIFRIKTGRKNAPVTFDMYMFRACSARKDAPVIISGDMCFPRMFKKEMIETITKNDINFVMFNRTELAPDVSSYDLQETKNGRNELGRKIWDSLQDGNCGGQLKSAYPDYTFGAISAWAWGYSRCVDALEILGNVDLDMIAFTGHSRGAKTAALAGAVDERAKIVNPNATCCGGYSGYRIYIEAENEKGDIKPSERLDNIFHFFPAWMGQGMKQYIGNEQKLPFDSHDFKAMVAPRILYVSEAAHDIMGNPVGSYQTTMAAKEVYKFLGCEENLFWSFRSGPHDQKVEDIAQLVNLIKHIKNGEPLNDNFFKKPFKEPQPAYDWCAPNQE